MKYLLAHAHRHLLSEFADGRVLLAFDFDGTLAPIVKDPTLARMREATSERLRQVTAHYPCVVVTGRSGADLRPRLEEVPVVAIVGNHGLEDEHADEHADDHTSSSIARYEERVASWRPVLEHMMSSYAGVEIEDKRYSLAVHYRKSRKKPEALEALRAAAIKLGEGVRWVGGKQVVNLVPNDAPNKGAALQLLRDRTRSERAIYVGDDLTDEDVFTLDEPGRLLSVRVGRTRHSSATYYLRSQLEIDAMLEVLTDLRRA